MCGRCAVPNSILFLGRPGVGKTTVIREMARVLADDLHKRVVIVDTRCAAAGACHLHRSPQAQVRVTINQLCCLQQRDWRAMETCRIQQLAAPGACRFQIRRSNTASWYASSVQRLARSVIHCSFAETSSRMEPSLERCSIQYCQ